MGFYIYIAFKNILRQKKRSFSLGINYGIVTFILVLLLSFSGGARENITRNVAQANAGHITISGNYYIDGRAFRGIQKVGEINQLVLDMFGQETEIYNRYIIRSAVYYNGLSKRLQFTGINSDKDKGFQNQIDFIFGSWEEFAGNPQGVILPEDIAVYFGLSYNDDILISTRTRFGAFNTGTLKVKGIYKTANFFIRGQVVSHFEFLRGLDLGPEDTAVLMYIYFKDGKSFGQRRDRLLTVLEGAGFVVSKPQTDNEALDAISSASPRYKKEAESVNKIELTLATLDEALGLVKNITVAVNGIGFFIAAIMLFVIAVSIFINLRMTINDRLAEIGTMRTIGLRGSAVTALFMTENVLLSLVFTVLGIAAALVIILLFVLVIPIPQIDILSLFLSGNHLVLSPTVGSISLIVVVILAFTAIFSFFPARYGGKIRPVDALNKVY